MYAMENNILKKKKKNNICIIYENNSALEENKGRMREGIIVEGIYKYIK